MHPTRLARAARLSARAAAVLAVVAIAIPWLPTFADAAPKTPAAGLTTDPTAGLVFTSLVRGATGTACAGLWQLAMTTPAAPMLCSHGPDPVPQSRPAPATAADTAADGGGDGGGNPRRTTTTTGPATTTTTQPAPTTTTTQPAPTTTTQPAPTTTTLPPPPPPPPAGATYCYADGQSGNRVEAIYAHANDVADRFSQVTPGLRKAAVDADAIFNLSAGETGATRHLRFVTDDACQPVMHDVAMSAAGDDSFSATVDEIRAQGYTRADRKYLVFVDAAMYCGIGTVARDDRPFANNTNNLTASYSRVDRGCWGGKVAAHELMHNLGGVQNTAPHASGGYHCFETVDRMCYNDGGSYYSNGGTMKANCAPRADLFDCGHDDYYLAGTVPSTSYLANHWNTALSSWLETRDGGATSPGPELAPALAPDPPPVSETWSGTSTPLGPSSYAVNSGAGVVNTSITSNGSLSLAIQLSDGTVVANRTGTGTQTVSVHVPRGTVTFVVSGGIMANYTLTVTYPPQ